MAVGQLSHSEPRFYAKIESDSAVAREILPRLFPATTQKVG